MPLRVKFLLVNLLISTGIIPLLLWNLWAVGIIDWARSSQATVPIMNPTSMLGPLFWAFLATFLTAGAGSAWSWRLAHSLPQKESQLTAALRYMATIIIASPGMLLIVSRIH